MLCSLRSTETRRRPRRTSRPGNTSGDNRVNSHGEEPFVGGGSQAVADSLPQFVDLAVSLHSRHGTELERLDGATHRGVWVTSKHFAQRFG
jgi:hypothetical protein